MYKLYVDIAYLYIVHYSHTDLLPQ